MVSFNLQNSKCVKKARTAKLPPAKCNATGLKDLALGLHQTFVWGFQAPLYSKILTYTNSIFKAGIKVRKKNLSFLTSNSAFGNNLGQVTRLFMSSLRFSWCLVITFIKYLKVNTKVMERIRLAWHPDIIRRSQGQVCCRSSLIWSRLKHRKAQKSTKETKKIK